MALKSVSTFLQRPPASAYDQAKQLLEQHRRAKVGAALERGGPVAEAIAECAFAAKADWEFQEVCARLEQLGESTMSVGHWLGRYHSPRQQA